MDNVSYSVHTWRNINVYIGLHRVCSKTEKPTNRVHFYVARDKIGELRLYLGKPDRGDTEFYCSSGKKGMCLTYRLNNFELKDEDFDNLKWEDEPVEVFINIED